MEFLASALQSLKPQLDDDFIDRLNYYYTTSMLLIFGLIISAKQWVGQPIECWVPAQFTGAWEQYTEDYCFVQNTYWLPLRHVIPVSYYERERRQIGYYQWVPFILAFQALFFYFPYMFWTLLNWQTGIDINGICTEAEKLTGMEPKDQKRFLQSLTSYVREILAAEKEIGNRCFFDFWKITATHYGFYVVILHFSMKILFLFNSVAQIFFMNAVLGNRDATYGFWTFFNMIRGIQWEESGVFPRITMCDFEVRVLGNLHRYTVQCVLMINMFNEKIYLFMWYWTNLMAVLNIINLLYWLGISLNPSERIRYITNFIRIATETDETEIRFQKKFVLRFLRQDGVLLIRKIAYHASTVTAVKLTRNLYEDFKMRKIRRRCKKLSTMETKASQTEVALERKLNHVMKGIALDLPKPPAEEKMVQTSSMSSTVKSMNPFRKTKLIQMLKSRHL